jgi:hypothetical protein
MIAQGSSVKTVILTSTSQQVLPATTGGMRRTQLCIINQDGVDVVTIMKGITPAVSLAGWILPTKYSSYLEADDGGYTCWQGAVQGIVATNNTVITVIESWVSDTPTDWFK